MLMDEPISLPVMPGQPYDKVNIRSESGERAEQCEPERGLPGESRDTPPDQQPDDDIDMHRRSESKDPIFSTRRTSGEEHRRDNTAR